MPQDLSTRRDIEHLVDSFYQKALKDPLIGHFFTEVVALNWQTHIPLICDFWETVLLDRLVYKGNPMVKHLELHGKSSISEAHFERWLLLWSSSVTDDFEGPIADEAIRRATQIAGLMELKISQL